MTAKTVTFAVQMGSGGFELARAVAEKLQYRYYDWEVTANAAAEAGVPPESIAAAEQYTSAFRRVVDRLLMAGAYASDEAVMVGPDAATMTSAIRALTSGDYRRLVERVVKELGSRGEAVIVGHAGQTVLGPEPGVLKVLVTGSPALRAARVASEAGVAADEATKLVRQSDDERLAFFRDVYRVNLRDASLYDLTLNTDRLSPEFCVDAIIQAAHGVAGIIEEPPPAADAVTLRS
ncbi:MAG TPA: cytidylate kinase-like family protein [Dehalococcoidia bacterium]|nr:cytidylate kinase-like family protein [Dehalococcoidia bacterium]